MWSSRAHPRCGCAATGDVIPQVGDGDLASRSDIYHESTGSVDCTNDRVDDVVYVDEVARLLASAMENRRTRCVMSLNE